MADPEPYVSIKPLSYEPSYIQNASVLSDKAQTLGTTTFIDVESFNGAAARYMATATDSSVKIYNINSWCEELSFQQFLSNVSVEGNSERIIPIRMSSDEAEGTLNVTSEFIYIDCNGSGIQGKIQGWAMHLTGQGVIGGNRWDRPYVELAVVNAAVELNLTISIDQNFWFLSR